MKLGITINRPPRDGQMAFVARRILHSIELLQKAMRSRRRSRGPQCRTPDIGETFFRSACRNLALGFAFLNP